MADYDPEALEQMMAFLTENERTAGVAAFKAILANAPASLQRISQQAGLAPDAVAEAVTHLTDLGLMIRDDAGTVVGSLGLTLVPTSHRLRMRGNSYYTWCAEDAVGIQAALEEDAEVTSFCYQCGQTVAIELKRGELVKANPPGIRLWLVEGEVGRSAVEDT